VFNVDNSSQPWLLLTYDSLKLINGLGPGFLGKSAYTCVKENVA